MSNEFQSQSVPNFKRLAKIRLILYLPDALFVSVKKFHYL